MIQTVWNTDWHKPVVKQVPVKKTPNSEIKDIIAKHLDDKGAMTVESVTKLVDRTHVATRHILVEMRREGRIISRRLHLAGNTTYWALTIEDIEKAEKVVKEQRRLG